MKIYLILICVITTFCEIRFVFETFRHGARSPVFLNYETDVFGYKWSGAGELTSIGMRQHYLLGYRNRKTYSNFLSQSYDRNEIYVMSTDFNRTIMSAYSHLQGLYPPSTGPLLNKNQTEVAIPPINDTNFESLIKELKNDVLPYRSQVFPIHVIGKSDKYYSLIDKENCLGVKSILEKNLNKQTVRNFINLFNLTYYKFFNERYNITELNHEKIHQISDAFISLYTENYSFSEFDDDFVKNFYTMALKALEMEMFDKKFDDENFYYGRLSMTPTFKSLLDWMKTRIFYDLEGKGYVSFKAPKMVLFSSHDTYLSAIQGYMRAVFGLNRFIYTPFASSIFFELHVNENGKTEDDYYVKAMLNDEPILEISFKEFEARVLNYSIPQNEINSFCGFENEISVSTMTVPLQLITIVLSIISVVLLFIIILLCRKKNSLPTESTNIYENIV